MPLTGHLHRLRHRFAVGAHRERRVPVTIIQAQLGHAHLPTTSVNLNHLGPQDVIAAGRRPKDPA